MLHDNLNPLCDVGFMQFHKPCNLALGSIGLAARVLLDFLIDLIESRVFCIVLQHIQDETFLNCLLHRVDMECLTLAPGVQATEQLNGGRLRRCGKGKHRHIGLLAVALDFIGDHIFHICFDLFARTEGHGNSRHIFTSGGGMCLVNDDCKTLIFQPLHAVNDIRELLNGGSDNFGIAIQCYCQVSGVALIVHHANKTGLMLHTHDGFLQLAVNNHAVGNDDDIIENNLIVGIMQRSQTVSQPCDGVGLAGTGTVLNQIVLRGAVFTDISQNLADNIQLMIARENEVFGTFHLAGLLIDLFLHLNENELADEVKDGILGQNILPHIGHAVLVLKCGVTCTGGHTFTITHVERKEECSFSRKSGGHVDLFQIHSEVDKAACLEQEQTGLGATLGAVLIDGILVRLSGGVALQLKGDDGKAVQEDNHINALFITCPDLLHDGKNVHAVLAGQIRVKGCGGFGVHQVQMAVGDFDAVLQHLDQTTTGLGGLRVDEADDGVLQISLVDLAEIVHRVRLSVVQEFEQHLTVNGEIAVKVGGFANDIAIVLGQPFQQEFLIVFFGENIIHCLLPPCGSDDSSFPESFWQSTGFFSLYQ